MHIFPLLIRGSQVRILPGALLKSIVLQDKTCLPRPSSKREKRAGGIRRGGTPAPKLMHCLYIRYSRLKSCSGTATI